MRSGIFPDQRKRLPMTLAARTNLFPPTAWGYELWRKRALTLLSGRPFPLEEELGLMVDAVQPVTGLQFIDLGTSTGLYARALLLSGAGKVYALDLSLPMLKAAVSRVQARELPPGRWQQASGGSGGGMAIESIYEGFTPLLARAEAVPLPDASLDGAVVGGSWNEFPDPQAVIQEMYRLLRPGGRVWIMFSHRSDGWGQRMLGWTGLRFPAVEGLQRDLSKSGFETRGWREGSVGFVTGRKILNGR